MWCNLNGDVVNFYDDVVNIYGDVVNMPTAETIAITGTQRTKFAISTVSHVSTYSSALALLDAGSAFF